MRAFVAFLAFLADEAAFLALVRLPRATAAGCFDITLGSIARKSVVDKHPTVR